MQKRWNIMILPNTSGQTLNYNLSEQTLKLGALCIAILLVAACAVCALVVHQWKQNHAKQIGALQDEVHSRECRLEAIEGEFNELLIIEEKLRTIAGLKPRVLLIGEPGEGGKGGPGIGVSIPYPSDDVFPSYSFLGDGDSAPEALLEAIASAHDGLDEIFDAFEKEQDRLSKIPSINPVYSPEAWISSGYGYRTDPITGDRRFHDGTDIVAPRRTAIIAPADGRVTRAGWRNGLGRTVEIRHGYGYTTVFGHNEKLTVKRGDSVKRGDVIAYLGSTGRSTGPHLHYEVRLDGKTKNPYRYVIE